MAIYRFYRSPKIGDGLSRLTAFRSKLTNYIPSPSDPTATFWNWINDSRPIFFDLAFCNQATHALINADATIIPLSAQLDDLPAVESWLDATAQSMPAAAQTLLESDGISLGWLAAQTTRRQLFHYISRLHVIMQNLKGEADDDSLILFGSALTDRVNQVPVATRNKIAAWMQRKGLDTSWIAGTTTIRQVIHYILENVNWPRMPLGPANFG